jgi:hypothetical protein
VLTLVGACTVWVVAKVVRLEAEVHVLLQFRTNMENRMIDLMIDVNTPELDKLLLRFKRGDAMTDEEWLEMHDIVEHYHVESIRDPGSKDPSRRISLAIFLAALESRQKQQIRGRYKWYRGLTRTVFGLFQRKN